MKILVALSTLLVSADILHHYIGHPCAIQAAAALTLIVSIVVLLGYADPGDD